MKFEFSSVDELIEYIKTGVGAALEGYLKPEVLDYIKEFADLNVYDTYNPMKYKRRKSLLQDENYETKVSDDGMQLTITPQAEFNRGYRTSNSGNELAYLIEYGDGAMGHYYDHPKDKYYDPYVHTYKEPRPFMHPTQEILEEDYKELLRYALISVGLPVEN